MSRRSCNVCLSSTSAPAELAPTQPSPQLSIVSPPGRPGPLVPSPRTPSPAILPPQCLAPPTSQLANLPPAVQPPPPHSLQSPQHLKDYGVISPHFTVSCPSYETSTPPNLPLPAPISGHAPYFSLLPASCTPASQFAEHTSFPGAHHFVIKDSSFNDFSLAGSGIDKLLKSSMPDAFHNSAARDPPPKCHLGTRKEYIAMITNWVLGNSDHSEPILWMRGPFGVGKSAVAQSCAEAFQLQDKLAATLFFSRSNTNRDDPRRVFTSIAYQIATICPSFRDTIDARIRSDPALAVKSLSTQFEELLVRPLGQMNIAQSGIGGRVVIIDGLDECRGTSEQCEIIRVIAASARDQTTPFRWFITSRPEELIIRTMRSPTVSHVSFHLELPVSREIDHEILLYLTHEFAKIRESHGLTRSWPSKEDLVLLVDRTAGLWVYVTTIIRFIIDENSLGPREQLRIVIEFAKNMSPKAVSDNPLAEMDHFYTLIMKRLPLRIRTLIRRILLLHSAVSLTSFTIAGVLGLSEEQFRHVCASIQSVLKLWNYTNHRRSRFNFDFHFYHASFLDFMKDPRRSKELCIYGDFLIHSRREYLDWLYEVCSHSTGSFNVVFPSEPVLHKDWDYSQHYRYSLYCFWRLFSVPDCPIDAQTAASLEKIPFQTMLHLIPHSGISFIKPTKLLYLRDNLPTELRDKIIREDNCPIPGCTNTYKVWVLGHGDNETVATRHADGSLALENNQDPRPGRCFCGSWLECEWFLDT